MIRRLIGPVRASTPAKHSRRWRGLAAASLVVVSGAVLTPQLEPSASAVTAANGTSAPGQLQRQFVIGVWKEYPGAFQYWKALGINTLVGAPKSTTPNYVCAWDAAVAANKMLEAREPINQVPSADCGKTSGRIIAWMHPDEPENGSWGGSEKPIPVETIGRMYRADKATNPDRPVWLNLIGGPLAGHYGIPTDNKYAQYADWISADDYPIAARHNPPVGMIAREMDSTYAIGSRQAGRLAFIETGVVSPGRPAVTPAIMRGEIWEAVIHGARGIVYYTYNTNGPGTKPITVNNTTPDIRAMMQSQNWILSHLPVGLLQGLVNPPSMAVSVPGPLDAGWRANSKGRYVIVLNTSGDWVRKTMRLQGMGHSRWLSVFAERRSSFVNHAGYLTDTFAPYAAHIYYIG